MVMATVVFSAPLGTSTDACWSVPDCTATVPPAGPMLSDADGAADPAHLHATIAPSSSAPSATPLFDLPTRTFAFLTISSSSSGRRPGDPPTRATDRERARTHAHGFAQARSTGWTPPVTAHARGSACARAGATCEGPPSNSRA